MARRCFHLYLRQLHCTSARAASELLARPVSAPASVCAGGPSVNLFTVYVPTGRRLFPCRCCQRGRRVVERHACACPARCAADNAVRSDCRAMDPTAQPRCAAHLDLARPGRRARWHPCVQSLLSFPSTPLLYFWSRVVPRDTASFMHHDLVHLSSGRAQGPFCLMVPSARCQPRFCWWHLPLSGILVTVM